MAGYRDMVYVNGISLKQVASKERWCGTLTFYVDSANGNSTLGTIRWARRWKPAMKSAFVMWTHATTHPTRSCVGGVCALRRQGDHRGATHVRLEDNTFVWNGVEVASGSDGTFNVSTDAIRGNTFSYNGRKGLAGDRAHRMLLENNTISYNNVSAFQKRCCCGDQSRQDGWADRAQNLF